MLDLSLSKFQIDAEYEVSSTAGKIEEGMALESILEDNIFKVRPATGVAGASFAGIAWGYFTSPDTAPITESGTVDASAYTYTLSQIPNATTAILVKPATVNPITGVVTPTGAALTQATGTLATGQYSLSGNTLTFFSDMGGKTVYIEYRYNLSAMQAAAFVGDGITSTLAADLSGTIGVIERGRVRTSNFDTSVDWSSNPTNITLGAGGIFTVGGDGEKVNATVYSIPSADSQFLGLRFDSLG